jgi:hypothetical protein
MLKKDSVKVSSINDIIVSSTGNQNAKWDTR